MKQLQTFPIAEQLSVLHGNRVETEIIVREIFSEAVYLQHGISLPPAAVVIDAGANIGVFALFVAARCESPTVYSFEPIPDTFAILQANLGRSPNQQATLLAFNQGVSSARGTATFDFRPGFASCSTMHPDESAEKLALAEAFTLDCMRQSKNPLISGFTKLAPKFLSQLVAKQANQYFGRSQPVECSLLAIDDIMAEQQLDSVDLLKIDVEGAEFHVLEGISDQNWSRIQQIVIEVEPEGVADMSNIERAREILSKRGFQTANQENASPAAGVMVYAWR